MESHKMRDLVQEISKQIDTLPRSQKTVAEYVINNLNSIPFDTLQKAAEKAGVSTTTIIRFAKELGFSGYKELQSTLINNIRGNIGLPERLRQQKTSQAKNQPQDYIAEEIIAIEKTFQTLSQERLERALSLALNAKNIYVLGLRVCFSLAFLFATVLGQTRNNVHLISGLANTYPENIMAAGKDDVCFVFAFPRFVKECKSIVHQLKRRGVSIILITEPSYSEIVALSDVSLYTYPCAVGFKGSFAAPVCLINYLITEMIKADPEQAANVATRIENYLNDNYI